MEQEPKKVICATHGEIGEVEEMWEAFGMFENHRQKEDGCLGMTVEEDEPDNTALVGFNLP